MRRAITPLLFQLLVALGCSKAPRVPKDAPAAEAPPPDATAQARTSSAAEAARPSAREAAETFGFALYREIAKADGNVAVSPLSVRSTLAMLAVGARGETLAELERGLGLSGANAHAALAARLAELRGAAAAPIDLALIARLWVDDGFALEPSFQQTLGGLYGAKATPLALSRDPARATRTINEAIKKDTRALIPELLPAGLIDGLTRVVLTDAIYFKAPWARAFSADATAPAPFTVAPKEEVEVPMMRQRGRFRHADLGELQLLELPYHGEAFSLLVALPRAGASLTSLEASLSAALLERWTQQLAFAEVEVQLPRFSVNHEAALKEPLQALGIRLPFDAKRADLRGIADAELSVSAVVHQAVLKVSEEGTEASGATGAVIGLRSLRPSQPPPVRFVADRPFLFLLREAKTGEVLFLGRLTRPGA
jgi:serpin B